MIKLHEYIGKFVAVHIGTPAYPYGAVVKVMDYDSTSSGEISFLVTNDIKDDSCSYSNDTIAKWINLSNIQTVITLTLPKVTFWSRMLFKLKEKYLRFTKKKV